MRVLKQIKYSQFIYQQDTNNIIYRRSYHGSNPTTMRRLIITTAALLTLLINVQGAQYDTLRNTSYGIELNQFITGSGYSSGTELLFSATEGRRNLNFGFYYCSEARRITGIIANHEIALLKIHNRRIFRPYAFYNGIARITKLEYDGTSTGDISHTGIYKTFEHHLGIGLRVHVTKVIYFSGSTGYGIYFGSMKKPLIVTGTNEITGSNGFSPIVKLGFGLIL